jgi:ethanolamine ammonia-lyase small subunit
VKLDDATMEAVMAAVVRRLAAEAEAAAPGSTSPGGCGGEEGHSCTADPRPVHAVERPMYEAMLPRLVRLTSSQIAVGRAGNRFKTDLYLRTREGQADARDAVHSEVDADWAQKNDCLALQTRARDRHEYLLYPNQGRRLDATSRATVEAHAATKPDVQIIVGDGLSPNAITVNGAATLSSLRRAFAAAGWRTGVTFFVKLARIGVADEIGVVTGARATVILVGERPGLGTGDSLSLYLAVNPRLDQDNAEKNCVSNVRPIGIAPAEAAREAVTILKRSFEKGVGGVALGLGWGRQ